VRAISCTAKVMPDGRLALPPEVVKQLNVKRKKTRRIIIFTDKAPREDLSRFCGRWKDDRDADEIIREIYADRDKNCRSDRFEL
jgi:hypothetical protein